MPKLRGKAKAAFVARMKKGRKKAGKPRAARRKKTTHKKHHAKRFGSMAHMLSGSNPQAAKAVKQVTDRLTSEMGRMKKKLEKECATALRKAKKHPGRKKVRRHKKSSKKRARKAHRTHARKAHSHRSKTHHVRDVSRRIYGSKSVSASAIVRGAKNKTWTCAGPRRTGCGGGSRGGHVLDRKRR